VELNQEPQLKPYIDLPRMAEKSQRMVKDALDAFVSRDTTLARDVCARDSEVDALKEQNGGEQDGAPPARLRSERAAL
jgi:phosphate transport system protein